MNATELARLYRENHDDVLDGLQRQLRNVEPADVEDALSDAWMTLARMPDSYVQSDQDGGNVTGWLTVVARRNALRRRYRPIDALDRRQLSDGNSDGGGAGHDRKARRRAARAAVALLRDTSIPLNKRRGIASALLGLSAEQYQAATGASYSAWNRHVHEGRQIARALLADLVASDED